MDDSFVVRGNYCLADLLRNWQCFIDRNLRACNAICERLAFNQLHDKQTSTT
jgi:hypothetical protein